MYKVFVYGTLKMGKSNHPLLRDSAYLTDHETDPEFLMINLGGFPGVVRDGATSIKGEVYEVDDETLARLDRLEGYNENDSREHNLYTREVLEYSPIEDEPVYIYIYNTNQIIKEGEWN